MKQLCCVLSTFTGVALLLAGCHAGPTIYRVQGTATYKGAPIVAGVIFFDPDVTKRNDGPQGYAIIKNGAYDTASKGGRGIVGGPHLVRIDGFDGNPGEELPMGKVVFRGYTQAVDFPKSDSTKDFQIPAK